MTSRKILFFSITKNEFGSEVTEPGEIAKDILNYIKDLEPLEKQFNISDNKFCQLMSVTGRSSLRILFKSAKNSYRAPLMNRNTGAERPNPKTLSEGERIKTHMIMKIKPTEIILCLERGSGTLTINQFINYLNSKADIYHNHIDEHRNYSFDFQIIAENNFLTEVRDLERVIEGELYIDKDVLGDDTLVYSKRTANVQKNLKLILKAERGTSIRDTVIDAFNVFNSGKKSTISRIRVKGKDENANEKLIDSELIAKMQFVDAQIHNDTGEVNSDNIFDQIAAIATHL